MEWWSGKGVQLGGSTSSASLRLRRTNGLFPLTPALSLGEREKGSAALEQAWRFVEVGSGGDNGVKE